MVKIKIGDQVKIQAGKDRGKSGKVIQVFRDQGKVVVEGVNMFSKHLKPRTRNTAGQKVKFSAPLRIANVQLVCPKCLKAARVGRKTLEDKMRVRFCAACKEVIY